MSDPGAKDIRMEQVTPYIKYSPSYTFTSTSSILICMYVCTTYSDGLNNEPVVCTMMSQRTTSNQYAMTMSREDISLLSITSKLISFICSANRCSLVHPQLEILSTDFNLHAAIHYIF